MKDIYSGITQGMTNSQVKKVLESAFQSLTEVDSATRASELDSVLNNFYYTSKLEAANAPEMYRTYFPIAIRMKLIYETNLAATNIVSKPNGCAV